MSLRCWDFCECNDSHFNVDNCEKYTNLLLVDEDLKYSVSNSEGLIREG